MNLVAAIEKLINERGSAAVLRDHLAFIRDQAKSLESENSALRKRVVELETLSAALAAQLATAKHEKDKASNLKLQTISGELMVDGILWSYTADERTGNWIHFLPLCPHCRTRLCVDDVSDMFALERKDQRVRYHCDYDTCGNFDSIFQGLASDREEKAARHINRKHQSASKS